MKMEQAKGKNVLISGASIAGLSTAWWMNHLGYRVTIVEMAREPRVNGAAVDLRGMTIEIVKRMGIYEALKAKKLGVDRVEFKNADDVTEGSLVMQSDGAEPAGDEIEIERDQFVSIVLNALTPDVEFLFSNSIAALRQTADAMEVRFADGLQRDFHLVFGCDGMHSVVRKLWFGAERDYVYFLGAYFSLTIVNKLLIPQRTMQMYNVPDKAVMLNAYNGKTDVIFCFNSGVEIPYDYRDAGQQRQMIRDQFAGIGWRTEELLEEVQQSNAFYFDKFCQIKMPLWTKGRVALVGDAGYCASPAAGMGASLSMTGAAAVADALEKHDGDFEAAFADYNEGLRPFIEEVQAMAERNVRENFIPRTEEAIRERNLKTTSF